MSCNGCRVLRKGCSESCILRPCLQWIETSEAQGHATVFVAKFFGRAGLMSFISAVPESQRPCMFPFLPLFFFSFSIFSIFIFLMFSIPFLFQLCFSLCCSKPVDALLIPSTAPLAFYGLATGMFVKPPLTPSYEAARCGRSTISSPLVLPICPPTKLPRLKSPVPTCGSYEILIPIHDSPTPDPGSLRNASDPRNHPPKTN